mmetsp:Transcript_36939/g.59765  ORF Transcript_36939/g.59765 Transcript_36939/m.59765 type:complete len:233 (+) Transcript_36939:1337-2035(+)
MARLRRYLAVSSRIRRLRTVVLVRGSCFCMRASLPASRSSSKPPSSSSESESAPSLFSSPLACSCPSASFSPPCASPSTSSAPGATSAFGFRRAALFSSLPLFSPSLAATTPVASAFAVSPSFKSDDSICFAFRSRRAASTASCSLTTISCIRGSYPFHLSRFPSKSKASSTITSSGLISVCVYFAPSFLGRSVQVFALWVIAPQFVHDPFLNLFAAGPLNLPRSYQSCGFA